MSITKYEEICDSNAENGLIQLKAKDVPIIRDYILEEQNNLCAICKKPIEDESGTSLDHQHKRINDIAGPDGAGLIRGVAHRECNVLEGKIWNNTSRYMQPKDVDDRIEILENMIAYYKEGTYPLIHPSEKPKEEKVSKRNYNKLKKEYSKESKKKKFPEYPKSGKLTKALCELFVEFEIEPYN
jgi:hypothetical protein